MDYIITYEEYINGEFLEKRTTIFIENNESDDDLIKQSHEYLTQILGTSKNIIILDVVSLVDSEVDLDSFEG